MSLNLVSAQVADGDLVVQVRGDYGGSAVIRGELGASVAEAGGIRGPNVNIGHTYGPMLSVASILIGLTAHQEAMLYDLIGVHPLADAPKCPVHRSDTMDLVAPGAWACLRCQVASSPEACKEMDDDD